MKARVRGLWIAALAVTAVGCAAILGIDDGVPRDGAAPLDASDAQVDVASDAGSDAATDAGDGAVKICDVDAAFAPPTAFSKLDTAGNDAHLRLVPPSELTGVFQSVRDGGLGSTDIYIAQRPSIGDTWTQIASITPVNTLTADNEPTISADQLTLYLSHANGIDRATRISTQAAFSAPVAVPSLNSAASDFGPYLVDDSSALYFSSTRNSDAGIAELFVAQPLADGGFTPPANINGTALKTGDNRFAAVTADQLVLYFASNRGAGQGGFDIWIATRTSTSVAFGTPRVVAEVNGTTNEWPAWISSDRCRLYFTSDRGAGGDQNLFIATKIP
jgi:hypothetical protein